MDFFHYDFLRNAFFAALLASITCGIIGTYIVTRRLVFISGGITHSSFGGIGLAYFLGFPPLIGAAVFSILSAFGIDYLSKKTDIREDSAIGIVWSVGMALGIIFIALTPGYAPNLMTYLFGSILTVDMWDLIAMGLLSLVTILFFFYLYRWILYIAFDEEYARTKHIPVDWINSLLISLVSLAIVLNIRVVGVILVISFLTIPQVTANIFTNVFHKLIYLSVIFAFLGSVTGLLVSYYLNIPSGPAIISVFALVFICAKIIRKLFIRKSLQKQLKA